MTSTDIFALQERTYSLLPSQREFIFSPEPYAVSMGGWGTGKSYALCVKGVILSAAYPGNVGLIGRFHATDLKDSTIPMFFEVCPPSWIKDYRKSRNLVVLKNNSVILFRHIHDPNPKRRHITSTNLGWFGVDQIEEIEPQHWNTLIGRLRLPRAKRRFGFGTGNPNGKDWIYDMFFRDFRPFNPDEYMQAYRYGSRLGVATRSEENKKSNGGFVDDDYYDSLREQMPREWVARYLDCSFDDFSGKIFTEYTPASIHNIEPFDIPSHWRKIVSIDVGGSHPWAVLAHAVDERRNVVTYKELHVPGITTSVVANWIKNNLPWQSCQYVIDPENKVVAIELQQEHRIAALPAIKKVVPGILKVGGYMHVKTAKPLPDWYEDTQPLHLQQQWINHGSPSWFIMKSRCPETSRQLDRYVWDPEKVGKPVKKDDDGPDSLRYGIWLLPQAAAAQVVNYKRERLRTIDPGAAKEWDYLDKRIAARDRRKRMGYLSEIGVDELRDERYTIPVGGQKFEMW